MLRGWRPLNTLESTLGEKLLFSSAHFLQEWDEGHEAVIILWFAKLLHEGLGFLLGQLLTKVGKETEKFISNHGVVVIFVIKLKDLNEVVESTLVLGVLACLVHGVDLSLGEHLLALLGLSSDLFDGLEGWVQVAGTDEISGIEGINIAISLEVIDIENEFDGIDFLFLKTKLSHFELFVPLCSLTTIEGEDYKFLVQSIYSPGDVAASEVEQLWKDLPKTAPVMDSKLKCVFELPSAETETVKDDDHATSTATKEVTPTTVEDLVPAPVDDTPSITSSAPPSAVDQSPPPTAAPKTQPLSSSIASKVEKSSSEVSEKKVSAGTSLSKPIPPVAAKAAQDSTASQSMPMEMLTQDNANLQATFIVGIVLALIIGIILGKFVF